MNNSKIKFLPAYQSTDFGDARWLSIALLGVILLLGALLRFEGLDSRTIGHIEIYVPNINLPYDLSTPLPRLNLVNTLKGVLWEVHPPVWYVMMYLWTKVFGTSHLIIRLPSVFFGVGSVFLIYLLARLGNDWITAISSSAMLAFNGHNIFWSQIARPTTMACFTGLLSTILLIYSIQGHRWRRTALIGYLITTLIGLATLYYFWPIFATQILWVFFRCCNKEPLKSGLLQWQLFLLIVASPILSMAIFQSRQSYLGTDTIAAIRHFIQFGFLIDPSLDNLTATNPVVLNVLFVSALLLLALSFFARRKSRGSNQILDYESPPITLLSIAMIFSFLAMVAFAFIAIRTVTPKNDPLSISIAERSEVFFLVSLVPIAIFIMTVLIRHKIQQFRGSRFLISFSTLVKEPSSLITFLAFLPLIVIALINVFVPFFASRHMLIFTPYLFIVFARGMNFLLRSKTQWITMPLFLVILTCLVVMHYSSIQHYKQTPSSPTDYQGLAKQWQTQIHKNDLIFVQPHWVTTPIFYYLPWEDYSFVGSRYYQVIDDHPNQRIWVLSFQDLDLPKEMDLALTGYDRSMTIEDTGIKAELFVPP